MEEQPSRKPGAEEEDYACRYLMEQGYQIVKRNFRYGRIGEIDIVAYDNKILVFVEVKGRTQKDYGKPEDSIDRRKQAQLKKVASMYYYVNKLDNVDCRFDVIAIETIAGVRELRHHKRAFF